MLSDLDLALYAASNSDAASANQDFEALKEAEGSDLDVVAAVEMSRDADGKVGCWPYSNDGSQPRSD